MDTAKLKTILWILLSFPMLTAALIVYVTVRKDELKAERAKSKNDQTQYTNR